MDIEKEPDVSKKKTRNVYFCVAYSYYFSTSIDMVINRLQKAFNLSWLRVQISYHRINNLAELLNGDLVTKIGHGIFSKDLMDRKCNCYLPYKVNRKCVYEGKFLYRCINYEVKCSMCDAIYRGNTQQTFKKRMDDHFSDLLLLLKNRKKSDSFAAHFEQHFNTTTPHTDLRKYMTFKVEKQLNSIGAMKTLQNYIAIYVWRNA